MKRTFIFLLLILLSVIFLFEDKSYHMKIPVVFTDKSIPIIPVEIDKVYYPMQFSLHQKKSLKISKDLLDMLGDEPNHIKIGKLTLKNLKIQNKNVGFGFTKDKKGNKIRVQIGVLGRSDFAKYNLLLDFRHSNIYLSNDIKKLRKEGFFIERYEQVPFEILNGIIAIKINTDLGAQKFLITTRTQFSLLNEPNLETNKMVQGHKMFNSKQFFIENTDFGEKDLYFCKLDENADGILGMDFLRFHSLYFDFQNNLLYIGKI